MLSRRTEFMLPNEINVIDIVKQGDSYNYIMMLAFRLKKLITSNPRTKDMLVNLKCFISNSYKGKFFESEDGRFRFLKIKSNCLSSPCARTPDRVNGMHEILITSDKFFSINLWAVCSLLMDNTPNINIAQTQYKDMAGGDGKDQIIDKHLDSANAFFNEEQKANFRYDFATINQKQYNCVSMLPSITKIKKYSYNDPDSLISWFEPYNPAKEEYYKSESLKLYYEVNGMLSDEDLTYKAPSLLAPVEKKYRSTTGNFRRRRHRSDKIKSTLYSSIRNARSSKD